LPSFSYAEAIFYPPKPCSPGLMKLESFILQRINHLKVSIEEKLHYQKQPSKRPPESEENRKKGQTDLEKSEAIERAEIEKRKANNARQKAEEAFKKANQIKKETDEYIQKVKYRSRTRKSLRVKMKRRMEKANRAIAEAEQLKQLAIKAEKKAKDAESEAIKIEEETTNEP